MCRTASFSALILATLTSFYPSALGQGAVFLPTTPVKELQELLEESRTGHKLPALAAGIVRGDKQPVIAVTDVRKRDDDTLAGPDDQWHLGSNTKPMTALLLALLIDIGLIEWDATLEQVFPDRAKEWQAEQKQITMAHLLTHTSGLPPNWPVSWFFLAGDKSPREYRAEMMKKLGVAKLKSKPGEKYSYSNLGYTVLGAVIDRVTKSSWEEELAKKIFQPLGIKNAGFGPTGTVDALLQPWPHRSNGDAVAKDALHDNPPVMNPAGRVHMPLADYNRFLAETLRLARGEKGLLKPATARKLFTNPVGKGPHSLSGWIGYRKETDEMGLILRHNGSNTFNYVTGVVRPDQNLAVCVATNQGGEEAAAACAEVRKQILEQLTK
jgi:CubicO group peptidase (beta-lactamase class C family)